MAKVVLIAGAPASGKTVLADTLSRQLDLPVLAKDTIKETLFDTLGAEADDHLSRRLGQASFELLLNLIGEWARSNATFIVENAFRADDGPALRRLPKGSAVLGIYCQADTAVLLARARERLQSGQRHASHHHADIPRLIAAGVYGPPTIGDDLFIVPTDDFASPDYRLAVTEATERVARFVAEDWRCR